MSDPTVKDVLTIRQAAKVIGVHKATIYRWIHSGKLNPVLLNGKPLIKKDDIISVRKRHG